MNISYCPSLQVTYRLKPLPRSYEYHSWVAGWIVGCFVVVVVVIVFIVVFDVVLMVNMAAYLVHSFIQIPDWIQVVFFLDQWHNSKDKFLADDVRPFSWIFVKKTFVNSSVYPVLLTRRSILRELLPEPWPLRRDDHVTRWHQRPI